MVFFSATSKSEWGTGEDGDDVEKGGVARQLTNNRVLYANIDSDRSSKSVVRLQKDDFLTQISAVNAAITDIGQENIPDFDTNKANIVRWALGEDIDRELGGSDTDPNFFFAESLHSTPYVLNYGTDSDENADDVLFVSTNQGMLHAINGQTGKERWSYIPDPSLFENLGVYYNDPSGSHKYGLDGDIAFHVERNLDNENYKIVVIFRTKTRRKSIFWYGCYKC